MLECTELQVATVCDTAILVHVLHILVCWSSVGCYGEVFVAGRLALRLPRLKVWRLSDVCMQMMALRKWLRTGHLDPGDPRGLNDIRCFSLKYTNPASTSDGISIAQSFLCAVR